MEILEFSSLPKTAGGSSTGGVGIHAWDLSTKLSNSGYSVTVAGHNVGKYLQKKSTKDGVTIIGPSLISMMHALVCTILCYSWWKNYIRYFSGIRIKYKLKYLIYGIYVNSVFRVMDGKPDVIHIHHASYKWPFINYELDRRFAASRPPILVSEHGFHDWMFYERTEARKNLIKKGLQESDNIIYNTQQTKNEAERIFGEETTSGKIWTGINGVDMTQYNLTNPQRAKEKIGADKSSKLILYVGRLENRKGISEFIKSLNLISNMDLDVRIIGKGNDDRIWDQANSEIQRKITHEEYVEDLNKYYTAANIFISPSYHEDFGLTFIESMACGTPVVGTTGIPTEVIPPNNQFGYRAQIKDSQDLSKKIHKALMSDWDNEEIRNHAEQFSWDKKILEYHNIFKEVAH
jgi:glycosyltransferase involved in cell wall biosynthesis